MGSLLYRLNQKIKYHTSSDYFVKKVAEINRYKQIVSYNKSIFQIEECELIFSKREHLFVIEGIELFRKLRKQSNLVFAIQDNLLICSIDTIQVSITTAEELFIVNEIWVEGCYNVNTNTTKPIVVIDVGMNVGYASLFFASLDNVKRVYAYEPFKRTFEQGMVHFQMNPKLSEKIQANNFGLSSKDSREIVDYSPQHRGRTGIWGTELVLEKTVKTSREELNLRNFNKEIMKLVDAYSGCDFIWKVDCEGSEYDIFDALEVSLLKNVRVILMEWHKNGPMTLIKILKENGFSSLSFNSHSNKVGMLYAFK